MEEFIGCLVSLMGFLVCVAFLTARHEVPRVYRKEMKAFLRQEVVEIIHIPVVTKRAKVINCASLNPVVDRPLLGVATH